MYHGIEVFRDFIASLALHPYTDLLSFLRKPVCDPGRYDRPGIRSHLDAAQTVSRRLLQLSRKWLPFGLNPDSSLKASALLLHLWGL